MITTVIIVTIFHQGMVIYLARCWSCFWILMIVRWCWCQRRLILIGMIWCFSRISKWGVMPSWGHFKALFSYRHQTLHFCFQNTQIVNSEAQFGICLTLTRWQLKASFKVWNQALSSERSMALQFPDRTYLHRNFLKMTRLSCGVALCKYAAIFIVLRR